MMKSVQRALAVLTLAIAVPSIANAELSDIDILAAADAKRGDVHGAVWNLAVVDEAGDKSTLDVQARNQNFIAAYTSPPEQKGQKILERVQNMWFISPGASRPVPISPRQKLLGAASYGDIAAQRWSTDYRTVGRHSSMDDGRVVYQMDLVATSDFATYDAITLFIDKETLTAVRSVMKGADGRVIKTANYTYNNKVSSRHEHLSSFISEMVIEQDGKKTTLTYTDVKFTLLSPEMFQLVNVMSQ